MVMTTKAPAATLIATFFVVALHSFGDAFCPLPCTQLSNAARPLNALADDTSAQALSDYMAKSHEEKLRAVKDVEQKKNAEIAALKEEIQQLKSSQTNGSVSPSSLSPPAPLTTVDSEDLEGKLAAYQQFLAEYIVNAQNQKLLAVKEAELKAEQKFQERLEKLFSSTGVALPPSVSTDAVAVTVDEAVKPTLFQLRNSKVVAAAEAGKSRWGSMEVERAQKVAKASPVTISSSPAIVEPTLFDQRNAKIVAAATAGKSRWGNMEVERAKANGIAVTNVPGTVASSTVETPKEKVSLEDRVNLGARLLGA